MFYMDADGFAWRVYAFVENSYYLQTIEHSEDFFEAAVGFGTFQSALADYDASKLHEIIPKFHDTRLRIQQLEAAMEADPKKRLSTVGPEIACIFERREKASYLMDMLEKNLLPLRVTHNDTKLNNILFDKDSRKAAVVIDLDTVMPGLIAFDFGDAIRFGANTAAEDEMDLQKVSLSLELFDIYTRGFMESAGESLSENEIESLPWGAYLMTFEVGIRFLTDYLNGDQYFHVQREHHNLDRARTQLRLILDMEKKWNEMHTIVKKYAL